jgi:opacity protein-like surface antigen
MNRRLYGNWTGKVEYLYVTLGSMATNLNNQQSGMTLTATFNSRLADQLVRAGLNYKFD